jgi:Asp-tRNA(Asn)/Glu-tRNA(Gln) amidotransferase A subunit family amidase
VKNSVVAFHFAVFLSLSSATVFSLLFDVKDMTGRDEYKNTDIATAQEIELNPTASALAISSSENSTNKSRGPASIAEPSEAHQMFDISEICNSVDNQLKSQKVEKEFVQLKGLKNCQADEVVEIVNETNGYNASLLNVNEKIFKTDLLRLKNGENKISIKFKDKNQKFKTGIIKLSAQF